MKYAVLLGLMAGSLGAAVAAPAPPKPPATPTKPAPKAPGKPAAKTPAKPAAPMAFSPGELDLAPGETYLVELFVPSPTGKAAQGSLTYTPGKNVSVTPDARWTGKVPAWGTKTYPRITAAREAEGDIPVVAALEKGGQAKLTVKVARPQLEVVPGSFKLTVKVTNPFRKRPMNGRFTVSNPDRFLEDVTTREFKVPPGEKQELVVPLPGAAPACGEKYDFTFVVESYHGYKEQKTYSLAFPPQEEK
jgi:hypothetical protein